MNKTKAVSMAIEFPFSPRNPKASIFPPEILETGAFQDPQQAQGGHYGYQYQLYWCERISFVGIRRLYFCLAFRTWF